MQTTKGYQQRKPSQGSLFHWLMKSLPYVELSSLLEFGWQSVCRVPSQRCIQDHPDIAVHQAVGSSSKKGRGNRSVWVPCHHPMSPSSSFWPSSCIGMSTQGYHGVAYRSKGQLQACWYSPKSGLMPCHHSWLYPVEHWLVVLAGRHPVSYPMCMRVKSLQLCLTLCNRMDWSPPDSSVHGILLARILEYVAISSSRGSSQPRDQSFVP